MARMEKIMLRYLALVMLILSCSLLAVGCGGDNGNPNTDDASGTPGGTERTDSGTEGTASAMAPEVGTTSEPSSAPGVATDGPSTGDAPTAAGEAGDTGEAGEDVGVRALWDALRSSTKETFSDE